MGKKKKIIIVAHAMRLGGVETSLLGLLYSFDFNKYDVDLFLYLHDGEFLEYIPKAVNLINEHKDYASLLLPFSKNKLSVKIAKIASKLYSSIFVKRHKIKGENFVYLLTLHRYSHVLLPKVSNKRYDLALSFLTPHYTVLNKIYAKNKIAWIHTDYSQYGLDKTNEYKMWSKFKYIASISNDSTKAFLSVFPKLSEKVTLIENILPQEFVMSRSLAFKVDFDNKKINLCSVGRFSYPKNFDNIPEITKLLVDYGLDVVWYIIGYGPDEAVIKKKIYKFGIDKHVLLLGKKSNPYPYIKACDIYVQPSRFEGKAVTVREAQMLHKPVVITDFPSSNAQLEDDVDGVILPMETEAFANALRTFILNTKKQSELIDNCKQTDFSNVKEIDKIYSFIQ